MKALCNREGLLAAFGMVGGVVPSRSPKPILQNIKLVADPDEGSIVMATDLEVGVRYRVLGVKVDQPGSAVLPPVTVASFDPKTAHYMTKASLGVAVRVTEPPGLDLATVDEAPLADSSAGRDRSRLRGVAWWVGYVHECRLSG